MRRVWRGSRSQRTRAVNQVPDIRHYRRLFFPKTCVRAQCPSER
jgi:hypothetical protein